MSTETFISWLRVLCVLVAWIAATTTCRAQMSEYFLQVTHEMVTKHTDLEIRAELTRSGNIQDVFLFYRSSRESQFTPREMIVSGSTVIGSIPATDVVPPYVEYYIKLITNDGRQHTYPVIDPEFNPIMVQVRAQPTLSDAVLILSPQENEQLRFEDLVLSVSLIHLPEDVTIHDIQVYINETNITQYTIFTDDILLALPMNINNFHLPPGRHNVRLEFVRYNSDTREVMSWSFRIITPALTARPPAPEFRYNLSMRGESRNESFGGSSTWYNRSTLRFEGRLPWLRVHSNLHVTSEEHRTRQPQNRYSVSAETSWLRLHGGDTFPRFPSLIMNGRRLRGIFGQLELGWFNLDFTTGQTIRRVEGTELYTMPVGATDEFGNPIAPPLNSTLINDSTYAVFSYGTHTRTLTAVRPSFGHSRFIQMGFTYLHAKDDVGSIEFGNRPAENLVLGTDLRISLDNRRIEFVGEVAGSILNSDIARGNLSREELVDLLGQGAVDRMEDVVSLATLQRFITINQYLIPFDPLQGSSIAIDTHLRLNYFGNNFQIGYIRRGNDFHSFGLTALRRDVAGYRIRDRLRLMQNQLFFDVSAERLRDNLHNTKSHTTYFDRYDASVSYYPRQNIPSITIGYGYVRNDNRVDPSGADGHAAIRDVTNRFFTNLSHGFSFIAQNTGTISVNVSLRDDQTGRNADMDVYNVTAIINSRFDDVPLRTSLGFGVYTSRLPFFEPELDTFVRRHFNYYNIILGGEYRLFGGDLIVHASLLPTFGDYNRTVFQTGAQYYFVKNLSVVFQADYLVNPNARNDMVSNIVLRYDL